MIQFLKDLVCKDLPLKLASLALAITLWAVVSSVIDKAEREKGVTMSSNKQFQRVPISVVSSAGDATGFKVKPAQVTVFVQGTLEAITELEPASVRAIVDLSSWDGRQNLPLPVRVISPAGTAAVSVSPAEVEVIPPQVQPADEPEPQPEPAS